MTESQQQAINDYAKAVRGLEVTGVIPNRQNITGAIGEFIIEHFSGSFTRNATNTKDGDFTDSNGRQIEVKTVGTKLNGKPGKTSFMRNYDAPKGRLLDEDVIVVWLSRDFEINGVYRLNNEAVNHGAMWNKRTKSYSIDIGKVLNHAGCDQIR